MTEIIVFPKTSQNYIGYVPKFPTYFWDNLYFLDISRPPHKTTGLIKAHPNSNFPQLKIAVTWGIMDLVSLNTNSASDYAFVFFSRWFYAPNSRANPTKIEQKRIDMFFLAGAAAEQENVDSRL